MSANVLIIDDSAVMRRMIIRTLHMSRLDIAECYEAANGIQALARLGEHEVHAILLDINMPTMNGAQFAKRVRDDARLREIPMIVVSTEGASERLQELSELGALGFVRKPFQPEEIRELLEPLIGQVHDKPVAAELDDNAF